MGLCAVLFLHACGLTHGSSYPSTYPFTLEESLPEAEPSFSYDDSDPGGYFLAGMKCDLNDFSEKIEQGIFSFYLDCKMYYYRNFVNGLYVGVPTANQPFNCSLARGDDHATSGYISDNAQPSGASSEYKCLDYLNVPLFFIEPLSPWAPFFLASSCPVPPEELVCLIVVNGGQWCFTHYLSPGERSMIVPCLDTMTNFMSSCATLYDPLDMSGFETPVYLEGLTVYQTSVLRGLEYSPDRVCFPASYYAPSDDTNGDTMDTDLDEEADSKEESSVAMRNRLTLLVS